MSTVPRLRGSSERVVWGVVFGATLVAGMVWALATPLFTGPDEVSQARRAAAVARGELTGRQERPGPALLLTVDVPPLYADPAEETWLCHLGPLIDGAPQEPMALPSPPCPDLRRAPPGAGGAGELVPAETVQYRGQPFFYGLAGIPTLVDTGVSGARASRAVGVAITAALVASAAATAAASRRSWAAIGLLACLTPGVLHLAGSTNPSAIEVAAALSAWAAVASLASMPTLMGPATARLVRRLGLALVVLTACRGLGPGFAAAVIVAGAVSAGRERTVALTRRTDVRRWAVAVGAATVASLAWLAHIGATFPLPDRPGSGVGDAFGLLGWYLHQVVGVFGTNDSAVAPPAAALWCLIAVVAVAAGTAAGLGDEVVQPRRQAAVALVVLLAGLVLNVTAEGLSLPPIGFFWQGRYALPLLAGGVVLATTSCAPARPRRPAPRGPLGRGGSTGPIAATVTPALAATALVAVHVHGLWVVSEHHGSPTGSLRLLAIAVYGGSLALTSAAVLVGGSRERRPTEPTPGLGTREPPRARGGTAAAGAPSARGAARHDRQGRALRMRA